MESRTVDEFIQSSLNARREKIDAYMKFAYECEGIHTSRPMTLDEKWGCVALMQDLMTFRRPFEAPKTFQVKEVKENGDFVISFR